MNGKAKTDRMTGAHQRKGMSSTKGNSKGSTDSFDEAGDIDWRSQSDGSQHRSQSEEEIHFCMLSEGKVQNQRQRYIRKKMQVEDTRKI